MGPNIKDAGKRHDKKVALSSQAIRRRASMPWSLIFIINIDINGILQNYRWESIHACLGFSFSGKVVNKEKSLATLNVILFHSHGICLKFLVFGLQGDYGFRCKL